MGNLSFQKLKAFFDKYESKLAALTLVFGFIFDYLTLQRVDFLVDNLFIITYLILSGASIIIIDLYEDSRLKGWFFDKIYDFLPFIIQFCFGGLFSAFVIFYSKSASLLTSGVFVLILLFLLVGNEFFKKRYSKLVFQVGIYFVALFSFFIYFLPVLTRKMGALIFLGSGAISLILIGIFIFVIFYLDPERYEKENEKVLFLTIFGLYASMNILYFANIIPPIPLSLKIGDVYHLVERQENGNYLAMGERNTWREKFELSQDLHLPVGKSAYVFSSVFAPTDLTIEIIHDWQYFDETEDMWVSINQVSFPIRGGRNEGYRGFSRKDNVILGKWRVDIKTDRDQVIGRVRFDVKRADTPPTLETETI